ncbi:glycosyltransferase family 2 protein [Klebsiella sp. 2019SCSN059]|uniref:glycosyltransferase family 2 protein n=1 Tax=Klebsiella sp. 2019SCSN059 TaxID=2911173 RepID=UPI001F322996|nr:glycosyltransferase family 2 protein [Klebsiella sp. 2019SCSN059]MCF8601350.1 glycosyltransferase family 2 protein [Klebsiella sp. 2019SCSN059]HBR1047501.1 glycosyltransferase family 2 protein [Klebsiella pneumoniae]HBY0419268.1 glycosyltransferase family 2 protein [Klebsiella variicola]
MNRNVAILMAVRNGQDYLPNQLQSFLEQTYKHWSLYVSDDGSEDATVKIVEDFFSSHLDVQGRLTPGPCRGFCQNFQSLINNREIQSEYYAFSDQDDIWLPEKLQMAVEYLNSVPADIPALYCSSTTLIDSENHTIGESLHPRKPLGFANALLHNIASGNTMVFNHRARELLRAASSDMMVVHDWSLYQIVSACGGFIHFDKTPTVLYRQHVNNVIGDGRNIFLRGRNFLQSLSGDRRNWNDRNRIVLSNLLDSFTISAKNVFDDYYSIRSGSLFRRLKYFRRSGVYHQYKLGTLSTIIYVCTGKM